VRYAIEVSAEFAEEFEGVKAADRARVRKAIGALASQAEVETKHRKRLDLGRLVGPLPFEYQPPVWQLSVGGWRVFYDVTSTRVTVRALRFKYPHRTTEEVLMRQVGIRAARADLPRLVKLAQREKYLLTHHGRPAALLVGVEGYDYEDIVRMLDPEFWKMLAERRASIRPALALAELDERLATPRAKRRSPKKQPRA
jgi:prevent-host-death family protein